MVRKHTAYDRWRMTRKRPKTPAPKNGWVISDLAWLVNVPVRTLRHYVAEDLIRPLARRGTATRYPRRELLRLLGLLRLRGERMKLPDIKRHLDTLGNDELEAWLRERPLSDAITAALAADAAGQWPPVRDFTEVKRADSSSLSAPSASAPAVQPIRAPLTLHRVELLPGVSLEWSANPGPEAVAAVLEIRMKYGR